MSFTFVFPATLNSRSSDVVIATYSMSDPNSKPSDVFSHGFPKHIFKPVCNKYCRFECLS